MVGYGDGVENCARSIRSREKLVSPWNQDARGDVETNGELDAPLIGVLAEPKKRPRTRLTDGEVDATRTAHEQHVTMNAVVRQFRVHRGTPRAGQSMPRDSRPGGSCVILRSVRPGLYPIAKRRR